MADPTVTRGAEKRHGHLRSAVGIARLCSKPETRSREFTLRRQRAARDCPDLPLGELWSGRALSNAYLSRAYGTRIISNSLRFK